MNKHHKSAILELVKVTKSMIYIEQTNKQTKVHQRGVVDELNRGNQLA